MPESVCTDIILKRTRTAFMLTRILNTPFWAMFSMLSFILYKDLHATPVQVAAIVTIKPLASILSTYWSALVKSRPDRLVSNVVWATLISYLPFFFYPFIDNAWFFVASVGIYMTMYRGVIPAWMEILKLNVPKDSRARVFAFSSTMGYVGDAVLPFVLGWLLDGYFQAWRWIFPATAVISLCATFFQLRIPIRWSAIPEIPVKTIKNWFMEPWKNAWDILRARPDFWRFQIGFMLGGGGVMLMLPVLPQFFDDVLKLSYTELAVALILCKGIGFALSTPLWLKWIEKVNIFRLASWAMLPVCLFPICLLLAQFQLSWLFVAYICYGMMQGGSELSWNMSGPIFSKEEDSSSFSSINVLMVGLRGSFMPSLGAILCVATNSAFVLLLGGFLCLLASLRMSVYGREPKPLSVDV